MAKKSIAASVAGEIKRLSIDGHFTAKEIASIVGVSYQTVLNYQVRFGVRETGYERESERVRETEREPVVNLKGMDVQALVIGWGVQFRKVANNRPVVILAGFYIPETPLEKAISLMEKRGCRVVNRDEVLAQGWKRPE